MTRKIFAGENLLQNKIYKWYKSPAVPNGRRRREKIEFYYDFAIFKVHFYVLPENFCGSSQFSLRVAPSPPPD